MDNLTHSLVGALLGQAGLKRKSALAMPTLIIAANIPDIDAACLFWVQGLEHLAVRRGITHGPIAMLILPILLWAAMLAWDGWRRRTNPHRAPVHRGWLLALAYIGTLSHPAFDWLNTYGIRLLEPFSSRWFYGDSIFIIDLWLWLGLGFALWSSLRAERRRQPNWTRPAGIAVLAASAYIFANGALTGYAENRAVQALKAANVDNPLVVASPPPLTFWKRDIVWRDATKYGEGSYTLGQSMRLASSAAPHLAADPRLPAFAAANSEVRAFLFWSRMPVAVFDADGALTLTDQRYGQTFGSARFTVRATPQEPQP